MTPDEQHCLERLGWHTDRLSKLLQFLGGATFVSGRDDDVAREFYRSIRSALRDEYAAGESKGSALSQPERVHMQPALSEAITALVASSNGPIGRDLFEGVLNAHNTLYEAQLELKRLLDHVGSQGDDVD